MEPIRQMIFCAGARRRGPGQWETSGGRVLGLVGMGSTLRSAREAAYGIANAVRFRGMQIRKDIALQASEEEAKKGEFC